MALYNLPRGQTVWLPHVRFGTDHMLEWNFNKKKKKQKTEEFPYGSNLSYLFIAACLSVSLYPSPSVWLLSASAVSSSLSGKLTTL